MIIIVFQELMHLKSQFATSSLEGEMRLQCGAASANGGRRKQPYSFAEHGAIMVATVLYGHTVPVASTPADVALFGLLMEESLWWQIDGGL